MTTPFVRRSAGVEKPKWILKRSGGLRKAVLAVFALLVAVAGIGVALQHPRGAPQSRVASSLEATGTTLTGSETVEVNVAPAMPAPAKAEAQRNAVAPAEEDRLPPDPELSEPLAAEQSGQFQKLYESWNAEPTDEDATREMEAFFRGAFSTFSIRPKGVDVRCTQWVCRGRFRFDELRELYEMTKIDEADGVRIATTFPEESEDGSRSVSVYFSRKEQPEGALTDTLGR
jgi:hypothetical protein